jgi:hypothetical protein
MEHSLSGKPTMVIYCKGSPTWGRGPCFFAIHFVLLVLMFEISLRLLVSVDKICQLIHVTLSTLSPKPSPTCAFQTRWVPPRPWRRHRQLLCLLLTWITQSNERLRATGPYLYENTAVSHSLPIFDKSGNSFIKENIYSSLEWISLEIRSYQY